VQSFLDLVEDDAAAVARDEPAADAPMEEAGDNM
jgi:hypothetical protein